MQGLGRRAPFVFKVQGSGFRVQEVGSRAQVLRFGSTLKNSVGLGSRPSGFASQPSGFGSRDSECGSQVSGFGIRNPATTCAFPPNFWPFSRSALTWSSVSSFCVYRVSGFGFRQQPVRFRQTSGLLSEAL